MNIQKPKLHLGCSETYLEGYINIDLPPCEHTIKQDTKVDLYADITKLSYEPESISEIRLHHVFEHFDRPTALQLLIKWYIWLEDGGKLNIETPDFEKSVKSYFIGGQKTQGKNLRHIFGSHEASWAIHCDGWYKSKFRVHLKKLGFTDLKFSFKSWHGTHNITVSAKKKRPFLTYEEQLSAAKELLQLSLVDNSPSELRMLQVWIDNLMKQ